MKAFDWMMVGLIAFGAVVFGYYAGREDSPPDWRPRPEVVVEPYGSKNGTPEPLTNPVPITGEYVYDFYIDGSKVGGVVVLDEKDNVITQHEGPIKVKYLKNCSPSPAPTVTPTPDPAASPTPIAWTEAEKRIIEAVQKLDAVNAAQNEAIGMLIQRSSPDGTIDLGTTNTLHAGPKGGFELKARKREGKP